MSLPDPWVSKIFAKLTVTYGQGFLRQYDGVSLEAVKANWAEELSGFQQSGSAIRYALQYLPMNKAPTVLEFKDLCRRGMAASAPAQLEAPSEPADPAVIAKAKRAIKPIRNTGNKSWAYALKEREERSPAGLTQFQRQAWRDALGEVAQ